MTTQREKAPKANRGAGEKGGLRRSPPFPRQRVGHDAEASGDRGDDQRRSLWPTLGQPGRGRETNGEVLSARRRSGRHSTGAAGMLRE